MLHCKILYRTTYSFPAVKFTEFKNLFPKKNGFYFDSQNKQKKTTEIIEFRLFPPLFFQSENFASVAINMRTTLVEMGIC